MKLTNQRQIIVKEFGFTPLQTTLLGCVDGIVDSELDRGHDGLTMFD